MKTLVLFRVPALLLMAVLFLSPGVHADTLLNTASFSYPLNGATNVDTSIPFQWTSIASAQYYYLYVGTTQGGKDLLDSGQIQATSYYVLGLPTGRTLYARIWTEVSGSWNYSDISFVVTNSLNYAQLTYPQSGATGVKSQVTFTWSTVSNVQAYYLYVGTAQGTNDLANSGEIQTASYYVAGLPASRTLYARIWTKINNSWHYKDSTFTTGQSYAGFIYPKDGASGVKSQVTFKWTTAANAQSYYLYVGTSQGANDLANSGEIQTTSYYVAGLPASRTLYARIWTKMDSYWYYNDVTFSTGQSYAGFIYPQDGAAGLKNAITFQWTSIAGAEAYYLYVGKTQGGNDLVNSGEILGTNFYAEGLPTGWTLYARIWTKVNGNWTCNDLTFSTGPQAYAAFLYPRGGATGVDTTLPFQWTSIPNAQAYYLYVGTAWGAKDIYDSGEISTTSRYVAGIPTGQTIYARINTEINGSWYYNDISFVASKQLAYASFSYPQNEETDVKVATPFSWTPLSYAQGYELQLGTEPGANDLYDSGLSSATKYYYINYPTLPRHQWIYGRIRTKIDGSWYNSNIQFMMNDPGAYAPSDQVNEAFQLINQVRAMADANNNPLSGTLLYNYVTNEGRQAAVCSDYAAVLYLLLYDNYVGDARILHIAMDTDLYDTHTLVEFYNEVQQSWMLLDPTFTMTALRASDGLYATAEDIQSSTFNFDWKSILYDFVNSNGNAAADAYYIDYPLLYLNICRSSSPCTNGSGNSPLPYMEPVSMLYSGSKNVFTLQQQGGGTCSAVVNGTTTQYPCDGIDNLSRSFWATSLSLDPTSQTAAQAYMLNRYVFPLK